MKTCTACCIEKPLTSFGRQAKGKYGVTSVCKACTSVRGKLWHAANRERSNANKAVYNASNKKKKRAYGQAWRKRNADQLKAQAALWTKQNSDKKRASTAKRRAVSLQAVPAWADLTAIKNVYRWAKEITASTGIECQVDHIIPLQSPVVCGFHCWENLRLVTAASNKSKGNKWDTNWVGYP